MQMQDLNDDHNTGKESDAGMTSAENFAARSISTDTARQRKSYNAGLFLNFIYFSIFYSITHATVDAVLAFSTAELGATIGSWAGFVLYIFYTLSAFFLAKPALNLLGPKRSIMCGLAGFLAYVGSFYVALLHPPSAFAIFVLGAAVGGTGAGILWTAQGSYYVINAELYAKQEGRDMAEVSTNFAAIFAASYLGFEASFKIIATAVYVGERSGSTSSWQVVVFGMYTAAALVAVSAFQLKTMPLESNEHRITLITADGANSSHGILGIEAGDSINSTGLNPATLNPIQDQGAETRDEISAASRDDSSNGSQINMSRGSRIAGSRTDKLWWKEVRADSFAVWVALLRSAPLRYLIPYQLCFGFAASFVNTYINAVVVAGQQGDGYIGFLAGAATITAVILAAPYAYIANNVKAGMWYVMIFGGCCFLYAGIAALSMSVEQLGTWQSLVPFFIIHGAARGVWENTNKAVIADYFADQTMRDSAYAAVYCSSGLTGAIGFLLFKFVPSTAVAALNLIMAFLALAGYHYSYICAKGLANDSRRDIVSDPALE